ncbi:DUF748 domain-containing protein, partial [Methylogaea oryzae]|uniref:DUF748 domain-containing protein n=1 Tax=Methylogaea oryzae TaxID=1295382 RepID=UPI0012E30893
LEEGQIRQPAGGATTSMPLQLEGIDFQLDHFSSDGGEPAFLQLEAQADNGAKLSAHASLSLSPLAVDAALFVDDLPLQPLWQRYVAMPSLSLQQARPPWPPPSPTGPTAGSSSAPARSSCEIWTCRTRRSKPPYCRRRRWNFVASPWTCESSGPKSTPSRPTKPK